MLFTADGVTPVAPQDIVARLAAVSERLTLRWVPSAAGSYWGVMEKWRSGDPRWIEVQRGHIAAAGANDLIHMFDRSMPESSMASWIETHYGERNASKDPIGDARRIVEETERRNAAVREAKMQEIEANNEVKVKEMTDHQRRLLGGDTTETAAPMVSGAEFELPEEGGPVKKTRRRPKVVTA